MPRFARTAAALGVGVLLLLWGLATLEGIVVEERREAKARLDDARQTLAHYARRGLQGELADALMDAQPRVTEAADDPLLPARDLLLVEGGTQVLPRRLGFAPHDTTPARELYAGLRSGDTEDLQAAQDRDPEAPWAERLELHEAVHIALRAGDDVAVTAAVATLLRHRALWVLQTVNELPATLAMLDDLYEYSTPNEAWVAGLLVGPATGRARPGLQRQLLARRERFSQADFRFLATRIAALSARSAAPYDRFETQARAVDRAAVQVPVDLAGPALLHAGRWYAQPSADGVVGLAIELPPYLAAVELEMHEHGLLQAADALALPRLEAATAISELQVQVTAPRLVRAARDADARFWLKTTFVALAGALALTIAVLAIVGQRKNARFVELKSDFVATVSHELRTPLASIRLMAETLQRRTAGVPRVRDYPERIVREIDELAFLVENILSFNRLDKGRWEPRRSRVDVAEILEEIVQSLEYYGFANVQLSTEGIDGLIVRADPELLKLLLRNLAKNACTYNERTPVQLGVRAVCGPRHLVVEFEDNGVGIPTAQRKRVFDDFRRGGHSRARGSGLGLSICRKSAHAHGGRISIARSGPQGTTVRLEFPSSMVVGAGA